MTYTATVTSQGQVSIPAPLRKKYQLDKRIIKFEEQDGRIAVVPIKDILDLRGVFKTKKKVDFRKSRAAFEHYLATRHLGNKLT